MEPHRIKVDYDENLDILYASREGVNPAGLTNYEKVAGLVFRFDLKANELVGVILHNVSKRFRKTPDRAMLEDLVSFWLDSVPIPADLRA